MQRERVTPTTDQIVLRESGLRLRAGQVLIFLTGVVLLFILLRLIRSVLNARPPKLTLREPLALREPPTLREPVSLPQVPANVERVPAPASEEPAPAAERKPRAVVTERRRKRKVQPSQQKKRAKQRPAQRSRSRLAERVLLAAEVTAVVLFVGAGVALWDTLGDLNDTYRNLQRVDARILPTMMPAANPGELPEALARVRDGGQQSESLLPPLTSLPAPALPTPIPTSTPAPTMPAPTASAPVASAAVASAPFADAGVGWGTTVVMSAPRRAVEQARRLQIPAIGVDSFVYQDYGPQWLKLGVVQYGQQVPPGQPGNLVLAGHNDIYGEIFRHLDKLEKGEEITVLSESRRYTYRVRETQVVEPDETWVMLPTSDPTLTLISCYPYLVGTQRIVVFADFAP